MSDISPYLKPSYQWPGQAYADDPRLGDRVSFLFQETSESKLPASLLLNRWGSVGAGDHSGSVLAVLWGLPSDLGVQMNGGRAGASEGPANIRRFLYRLTWDPRRLAEAWRPPEIYDLGDLFFHGDESLGQRDDMSLKWTQLIRDKLIERSKGSWVLPIVLGGGHEWAYSSMLPFLEGLDPTETLIVNIDAHLDARPLTDKGPHSGTPFYRLLQQRPELARSFWEWGIQPTSCALSHWQWVVSRGGQVVFRDGCEAGLSPLQRSKGDRRKKIFLSIDIDAFDISLAPGCSAPAHGGLAWSDFLKLKNALQSLGDLHWLGIFEVAPPLDDLSQRTSRLAARLIHECLQT
jgi:formiminoglutamase